MDRGFAQTMSLLRRERGLSQRTVAAQLQISQALLSHYENGAREPGLEFLVRACDFYGVSSDYMLGRSDSIGDGKSMEEYCALIDELKNLTQRAEQRRQELQK